MISEPPTLKLPVFVDPTFAKTLPPTLMLRRDKTARHELRRDLPSSHYGMASETASQGGRRTMANGEWRMTRDGAQKSYSSRSILPLTLTVNVAPRFDFIAWLIMSGKHLVNLFACSQNVR